MRRTVIRLTLLTTTILACGIADAAPKWLPGAISSRRPDLSTQVSAEFIRGLHLITQCDQAKAAYTTAKQKLSEKSAICNAAEQARDTYERENAIFWRLFNMGFNSAIFPGKNASCSQLIDDYKDQAQAAKDQAWDEYSTKHNSCVFEGDSLSTLQNALSGAKNKVCEICGSWPSDLSDGMYDAHYCPMPSP